MVNRIDRWTERAKRAAEMSKTLVYERTGEGDKYLPLIISPENAKASVGGSVEAPFVIANSMREVQPEINLLVSPVPERLFARSARRRPRVDAADRRGRLMTDTLIPDPVGSDDDAARRGPSARPACRR